MAKFRLHLHDEFELDQAKREAAKRGPSFVQLYRQKRSEGRWRLIAAGAAFLFALGIGASFLLARAVRFLPLIRMLPMFLRR